MKARSLRKLITGLAFGTATAVASAQDYSQIYVFGDSLSDNGNLHAVTQDPNIPERFTNGAVAVEVLAAQLGLTLSPSYHLLPPEVTLGNYGNNYAIAGAITTDEDGNLATPDINLPTQVGAFLQIHGFQAPQDALYVVMIGGNDIRAARSVLVDGDLGARRDANKLLKKAIRSVETQLSTLISAGAQHIVVVNAPDIGAIPETDLVAAQALANADNIRDRIVAKKLEKFTRVLTAVYNGRLSAAVSDIEDATGIDIIEYDLFNFLDDAIDNYQEYGYTNNTDACVYAITGGGYNPECNFETFVFFDEIHPTAVTHQRAALELHQLLSEQ
ncbi:SGNH/GDSL hydrolase family protein [Litoribrevibacter albus]|uniref:Lysophospholipase n=1 Tax=Litoribrevibacter albus TaxID=1473156 RepID=A0AA37WA48_9GAMM|nr:SGNH/GDSL hydrolase family protein [Litoribrevibacter albus]GLQ33161.1 lysophospholipase [Litoribrevibacter albus]